MNTELFSGKAEIYAQNRPDYPPALFDYLDAEVGLRPGSVIADIGAGTGIFSQALLLRGCVVFAVEPNLDMGRKAELALNHFTGFSWVRGSAEQTTLADRQVDFIVVAQAFHWFDHNLFKRECQRILKPEGQVLLVWNNRDKTSPAVQRLQAINRTFCEQFKGFSGGSQQITAVYEFFRNGLYQQRTFANPLLLDEPRFIGSCLSSSYAPRQGDANWQSYVDGLTRLFGDYGSNGLLTIPYLTNSYVGQV